MQSTSEIIKDLKANGVDFSSLVFGIRDIMALPKILGVNEKAIFCVQGEFDKRQGLMVITNKRAFFMLKGLLFGLKIISFQYEQISGVYSEKGLMFGSIIIGSSGTNQKIAKVLITGIDKAVRLINEHIEAQKNSNLNISINNNIPVQISLADEIRSLAALRDDGLITEEEFQEQKRKLLAGGK